MHSSRCWAADVPRQVVFALVWVLFGCRSVERPPNHTLPLAPAPYASQLPNAVGEALLTIDRLDVAFASAARGQLDLSLAWRGGGRLVRVQWQLLLDGHPLGSGLYALGNLPEEQTPTVVTLSAPLLTPHLARDEGWRTVTLELIGELTVRRGLEERLPFATRKQVLVRGAPKF